MCTGNIREKHVFTAHKYLSVPNKSLMNISREKAITLQQNNLHFYFYFPLPPFNHPLFLFPLIMQNYRNVLQFACLKWKRLFQIGGNSLLQYDWYPYMWFLLHWLAMSHSCYNPIIYCYMNARFRAGFLQVLGSMPGCGKCLARGQGSVPGFTMTGQ